MYSTVRNSVHELVRHVLTVMIRLHSQEIDENVDTCMSNDLLVRSPSLVPMYLLSFRIFVYNATGELYEPGHLGEDEQPGPATRSMRDVAGALCADPEYAHTWRCQLTEPWHSSPKSPSRTNALWTPLGFAQVRSKLDLRPIRHAAPDRGVG